MSKSQFKDGESLSGCNLEDIKNYLNESEHNVLKINNWCVKDVTELKSDQTNRVMEVGREFGKGLTRSNSYIDEIKNFPEKCFFININKEEVDCDFTLEVVCPWCAYQFSDSWELSNGEHECNFCGQKFEIEDDIERTFCTTKI